MAIENVSFSASVDDWVRETTARLTAVHRESCQRLVAEAQTPVGGGGHMPVDTGYLRASGMASKGEPTLIAFDAKPDKGGVYTFDIGQTAVVLASLEPGETFYFCWTAEYGPRIEYGFKGEDSLGREYNQTGRGFVRLAAQRWQTIVNGVVADAKAAAALPPPTV